MKKRIGKINKNIEELNSLEKTPSELLDLFLQEKEAFNASTETIKQYRYHCVQFIHSIEDADRLPGYKVLTLDSYKNYIVELKKRDIKDVSIACIARSLRAWLYWLMENNYINPFHVKIPKYQKVVAETYTDEELAILLEKPGRNCSEVEYETWVFINVAIATGLRLSSILNTVLATELSKYDVDVIVVDKRDDVGGDASKSNSAIIHTGYDAAPGTLAGLSGG